MRRHRFATRYVALAVAVAAAAAYGVSARHSPRAAAADTAAGTITTASAYSRALHDRIDYEVYLPAGYANSTKRYPTVYLLHGRGDTMRAWTQEKADIDTAIADGSIPPVVVVMPDAPWSDRASWYVDSAYRGHDDPGKPVETALTRDLVRQVDRHYRTIDGRWARAIGGYSMGGAGALRYVLAHQKTFGAAIALSPAVFTPQPPADDDLRNYGAFGVGLRTFVPARYRALNYPRLLRHLDPALPVHVFLAAGDKEYVEPDPADAHHDIDFETAVAYNKLIRTPGVTADWRTLGGGHDWGTWSPAFAEGIRNVFGYIGTTKPTIIDTPLTGTAGDDWAGGIVPRDDGGSVLALAAGGSVHGQKHIGGLDDVVIGRTAAGGTAWTTQFGTTAADRLYGAVPASGGSVIVAGYTEGNLDGEHADNASADITLAKLDASGKRVWTTQFGDPAQADRGYALAPDGSGGAYVAGYSSGVVGDGANAGDKDAVVAHVSASGTVTWTREFGGPGEDKALGIAVSGPNVYVTGVTGGAMPGDGNTAHGGTDGWVAALSASGSLRWIHQVGTTDDDELSGVAVAGDGDVVTAGYTGGDLAGTASGGRDAVTIGWSPSGARRWRHQFGTASDDTAVRATTLGNGAVAVTGTTAGRMQAVAGGTDIYTTVLGADGAPTAVHQFGTAGTDGIDEFSEADLFAAASGDDLYVTGDTYGATTRGQGAGGSDVFDYAVRPAAGS